MKYESYEELQHDAHHIISMEMKTTIEVKNPGKYSREGMISTSQPSDDCHKGK